MNICVFCSSSNAVNNCFFEQTNQLGKIISNRNHQLVYGGANVGLMEHLAKSVSKNNGNVIGIIPQKIHDNNLSSSFVNELIITSTMDERKRLMREKSDAFIALPGGFGTLEEILEVITLKQLDYHQKPIVFLNTNNFFNSLFEQFEVSFTEKFAKENYRKLFTVVQTPEEAINYIENYKFEDLGNKWYIVPDKDE